MVTFPEKSSPDSAVKVIPALPVIVSVYTPSRINTVSPAVALLIAPWIVV